MSLFRVLQKWSAHPGPGEPVPSKCFLAHTFTTDARSPLKIITGSLDGTLRIYEPTDKDFTVTDLKLENRFQKPILQLLAGRLLRGGGFGLLILFPDEFQVFELQSSKAVLNLKTEYTDTFQGSMVHSCVSGPFGGNTQSDSICFQMMDGSLLLYEDGRMLFRRVLRNFLLPGPLAYIPSSDSIVTMSSEMQLESYSFQGISISSNLSLDVPSSRAHTPEEKEIEQEKKRKDEGVQPEWRCNLGQHSLDIQVGCFTKELSYQNDDVVVLCERSIFVVTTKGVIVWQQLIEYDPSVMFLYRKNPEDPNPRHHLMVASHQKSLHIYDTKRTLWVGMLPEIPSGLSVRRVKDVPNMIITCSDEGRVSTNYLGTDPPASYASIVDTEKEVDYKALDKEYRKLTQEVKLYTKKKKSNDYIKVKIQHQKCEPANRTAKVIKHQVLLYITPSHSEKIENIHINISPPHCATCQKSHIHLPSLDDKTTIPITFILKSNIIPVSLQAQIVVTHTVNSQPSYKQIKFDLPLLYVSKVVKPIKGATKQIMLTAKTPPDLHEIFAPELQEMGEICPEAFQRPHLLSFQLLCYDAFVTVQTSKKSEPWICVRSESYPALSLLLHELIKRHDVTHFEWGCSPPENLLLDQLNEYWETLAQFEATDDELKRYSFQLRAVQKRILFRLKERIPNPLTNLELLLRDSLEGVMQVGQSRDKLRAKVSAAENVAFALMRIYIYFLTISYQVDGSSHEKMTRLISECNNEEASQAWGPKSDAHIFYLLRTVFSKSSKDQAKTQPSIEQCDNLVKFKRHIRTLRDRLKKQASAAS